MTPLNNKDVVFCHIICRVAFVRSLVRNMRVFTEMNRYRRTICSRGKHAVLQMSPVEDPIMSGRPEGVWVTACSCRKEGNAHLFLPPWLARCIDEPRLKNKTTHMRIRTLIVLIVLILNLLSRQVSTTFVIHCEFMAAHLLLSTFSGLIE